MKKWLILLIIFSFCRCTPKVISYVNTKAKFQSFDSYRIVSVKLEGRKVEPESTKIFDDVKNQIIDQMTQRSYAISSIDPDLTLRYELNSATRSENINNNINNPINNPFGYPNNNFNSSAINESILLIELYDSKKKLVWQGSYDLKQERKEEKTSKVLKNAVDKIFTTYPYRSGSNQVYQELTSIKKKQND